MGKKSAGFRRDQAAGLERYTDERSKTTNAAELGGSSEYAFGGGRLRQGSRSPRKHAFKLDSSFEVGNLLLTIQAVGHWPQLFGHTLGMRIDIHGIGPQKSNEGYIEFIANLDCQ